jgi:hypothetical protein
VSDHSGHCHCGEIRFEFIGEPTDVSCCHCSICRRVSGSAFGVYVEIPETSLTVTSGAKNLSRYEPTENLRKEFCRICGVQLFTRHRKYAGNVYINLAVLDENRGLQPEYHQFVKSKAKWHEISDTLPQFAESPDNDA